MLRVLPLKNVILREIDGKLVPVLVYRGCHRHGPKLIRMSGK